MDKPDLHYVITDDDVRIAYQDFGSGPPVVLVPSLFSQVDALWDVDLTRQRVLEPLAANLRVLMFDSRGTGMSDGFVEAPSLRDRALDIKAVMDATGVERASLLGHAGGGLVTIGFAAEHPQRVDRLVLTNSFVGPSARSRADALFPSDQQPRPLDTGKPPGEQWGIEPDWFIKVSPSAAKYPDYVATLVKQQRSIGGRDTYNRQAESIAGLDVVDIAPLVEAPSLIGHTVGNRLHHLGYARLLAELIPHSTLIEFAGDDQQFWLADNWREIVDACISFITGAEVDAPTERRFAVVLFTDIVESTSASMATGDDEWHRQLDTHDRITGLVVSKHEGAIIKHTGDGVLATFTTPSQAVDAAIQLRDELAETGMRLRAGLHAGEIEIRGEDISGAVVNLAARVEQAAADDDIHTTKTIRDMLIGSPHHFDETGTHTLKGFDGEWRLYRIVTD